MRFPEQFRFTRKMMAEKPFLSSVTFLLSEPGISKGSFAIPILLSTPPEAYLDDIYFWVTAEIEMGWEHACVIPISPRWPTWQEMAYIKTLFWADDEVVIQFHPVQNQIAGCIDLWRPIDGKFPLPPSPPSGLDGERKCRICGCTDSDCSTCIKKTGNPCYWVDDDLCSACSPIKQAQ